MLVITIFVELCMVAVISRTPAGSPQAVSERPCCAVALGKTAWSEHGMANLNQTRLLCASHMGKTHSKPIVARQVNGMDATWAQHAMCEWASPPLSLSSLHHLKHITLRNQHVLNSYAAHNE
jgi:hypothetical protein